MEREGRTADGTARYLSADTLGRIPEARAKSLVPPLHAASRSPSAHGRPGPLVRGHDRRVCT